MRPAPTDIALAVAVTAAAELELAQGAAPVSNGPAAALAYALIGLSLLWRQQFPWLPALVVGATGALVTALTGQFEGLGLLLALLAASYTLAAASRDVRTAAFGGAVLVLGNGCRDVLDPGLQTAFDYAFSWVVLLVGASLGLAVRHSTERATTAEQRATSAELQRESRAREAVQVERERIARELHDSVAHHVSAIVLHAEVLRGQLAADDPRTALAARIAESGRSALAETRQLLGMLREPEDLRSPPGLDRLVELLDETRAADIAVDLREKGTARPVPAVVGTTAYRVVQEALTNVRRHANAQRVDVLLDWQAHSLQVVVADNGTGTSQDGPLGFGLIGMAERTRLVGGSLQTGTPAGGGFRVRAEFPLAQP